MWPGREGDRETERERNPRTLWYRLSNVMITAINHVRFLARSYLVRLVQICDVMVVQSAECAAP